MIAGTKSLCYNQTMKTHEEFMEQAIVMAQKAARKDEVPVGAVLVCRGRVIARAANTREAAKTLFRMQKYSR